MDHNVPTRRATSRQRRTPSVSHIHPNELHEEPETTVSLPLHGKTSPEKTQNPWPRRAPPVSPRGTTSRIPPRSPSARAPPAQCSPEFPPLRTPASGPGEAEEIKGHVVCSKLPEGALGGGVRQKDGNTIMFRRLHTYDDSRDAQQQQQHPFFLAFFISAHLLANIKIKPHLRGLVGPLHAGVAAHVPDGLGRHGPGVLPRGRGVDVQVLRLDAEVGRADLDLAGLSAWWGWDLFRDANTLRAAHGLRW